MTSTVSLAAGQGVVFLADWGNKDMTGGRGAEFGKASPFGLLLILALLVGIVFLVRSMNRHLRKLPASFDEDQPESGDDSAGVDGSDDGGSGGGAPGGGPGGPGGGPPGGADGPDAGGDGERDGAAPRSTFASPE